MNLYVNKLTEVLREHLSWHKARLKFMARFAGALLKLTTANGAKLALALNPHVQDASNYRRIQRFMAGFDFDFQAFGRFLLWLLPQKSDYVVVLDRTEWHFGQTPVNVLMIAIAYKGIAFPVLWKAFGKEGSSSTAEGKALFRRFLQLVEAEQIRAVICDREFIGEDWLSFLAEEEVPFVIRLRRRRQLALGHPEGPALPAEMFFRPLSVGNERLLRRRFVGGRQVSVLGKRLSEDEYLILATNAGAGEALRLYRRRWEIETLFGALKSRGFDLESTHVTRPGRIRKLIGLLALSFAWSHLIGQWRARREGGPTRKKHGRLEKSLFRYGLDHLQSVMLNVAEKQEALSRCLQLLACPSQFLSCT